MDKNEVKKKGIKGVKTVIYGRTLFVLSAFLVQFILLMITFLWLREYSFGFYLFFVVVSVVVVLHLFNHNGIPDLKLVWLLPLCMFPVFGALFYVYLGVQPNAHILKKRLEKMSLLMKEYILQDRQSIQELKEENVQMYHLANYMTNYDNSPVYENTRAVYYPLGDDQFPVILSELKKAEKFIFLEYFIIEEGYMWNSILEILKSKVNQGVEVRVMYDGMCSLSLLPTSYPKVLEREGIQCRVFSPIKPVFSSHYNNRDHRKILVIDGRVAFTGGTNLADEYINKKIRFGHWKDTAVLLEGAAVERFTYMFLELWNVSGSGEEDYKKYKTSVETLPESDGYFIPYSTNPFGPEHIGKRVYLDILNTAERYVHIMTPYLILDYEMLMAITYASKRGVEVTIIMPHIPDKQYAFAVAKTYYNELLEAGVKIYEYTPGFIHAKMFLADDKKAVVGTINLDYRSLYHHFECAVLLYKNSQIPVIEEDFQNTLAKSQEVTTEDYKKQNWLIRLEGKLLRMLAPLM